LAARILVSQTAGVPSGEVRIRTADYAPATLKLSAQSNLVEMGVTVRDRQGRASGGFQAADFQVFDNGAPREIQFFSEQRGAAANPQSSSALAGAPQPAPSEPPLPPSPPRNLALFFDDTHTEAFGLRQSRLAAEKLVASRRHPGDRFAIFTDSGSVMVDFTSDSAILLAGLARLSPHVEPAARGMTSCPTLTPYQAYVILNNLDAGAKNLAVSEAIGCNCWHVIGPTCAQYQVGKVEDMAEAVWSFSQHRSTHSLAALNLAVHALAAQRGTRILILVSAGFITGGMEKEMAAVVDAALRSRVVINSLDAEGLMGLDESPEMLTHNMSPENLPRIDWANRTLGVREQILSQVLQSASGATGGRFIHHTNDWESLLTLADEPEVSYLMGFAPHEGPDGKYHRLKVRLTRPGSYTLDTREGYFSEAPTPPAETVQERIDREVLATTVVPGFLSGTNVSVARDGSGQMKVTVVIAMDASHLVFAEREGRSVQQLTLATVLQDSNGTYVAGKQSVMNFALTAPTLATLRRNGFTATVSFIVPDGQYRVREVALEAVENHIATSTTPADSR
jgi:VWFA-related protein